MFSHLIILFSKKFKYYFTVIFFYQVLHNILRFSKHITNSLSVAKDNYSMLAIKISPKNKIAALSQQTPQNISIINPIPIIPIKC